MLNDIAVMVWKEFKEYFMQRSGIRGGLGSLLIILGVLGVFVPLQSGEAWFTMPILPLMWTWMPVLYSLSIITDSIAGERERHTLETLLASRLPDRAILLGKMSAAVLYSFSIGISGLLVGALALNIVHPEEGIRFYPLNTFASLLALNFLAPLLLAGLGVLVSLKAQTARQAYQRISIVLLILWVLPNLALIAVPESLRSQVALQLGGLDYWSILFGVIAIMAGVDALLVWICLKRFKRTRLALIL